jgi:hypothetical protein
MATSAASSTLRRFIARNPFSGAVTNEIIYPTLQSVVSQVGRLSTTGRAAQAKLAPFQRATILSRVVSFFISSLHHIMSPRTSTNASFTCGCLRTVTNIDGAQRRVGVISYT